MKNNILEFYKQTSCFTDLGLYKDFAKSLTDDINELCLLQRHQIIHPFVFNNSDKMKDKNSPYGDLMQIQPWRLKTESYIFTTAQAILAELLRRDKNYFHNRAIKDKVHVYCREQAILLAGILKAKGIPARCRSGFTYYITDGTSAGDHWITEYYNEKQKRWILVDADMHFENIKIDMNDIPRNEFIFGAEAYLELRKNKNNKNKIYYASEPVTYGINAAIRVLFYDFHCLMNDEVIFSNVPSYLVKKEFKLTEEEYIELDNLANLMIDPDGNFEKLQEIWNTKTKFRIMSDGLNM